jgi:hypothetical protein
MLRVQRGVVACCVMDWVVVGVAVVDFDVAVFGTYHTYSVQRT